MSITDQIRRAVPRQSEIHLLGTVKSQVQRGIFYISIFNFANILFISYQQGAFVSTFPTFWHYLIATGIGFGVVVAADYALVLPGEKDYQKRQDYLRDPLREDVEALRDEIGQLQNQLDEHSQDDD